VHIRETSLYAAARSPEVQKALKSATGTFLRELKNLPDKDAVYFDFLELVGLLGNPWEDD
jgi:hypothetical protein